MEQQIMKRIRGLENRTYIPYSRLADEAKKLKMNGSVLTIDGNGDLNFTKNILCKNVTADNNIKIEKNASDISNINDEIAVLKDTKLPYRMYNNVQEILNDWSNIPDGSCAMANSGPESWDATYVFKLSLLRVLTFAINKTPKNYIWVRAIASQNSSSGIASLSSVPFRKIPVLTTAGQLICNSAALSGALTASNVKSDNETRLAQCEADVANKADVEHTHTISEIEQLNDTLDNKADANHNHDSTYVKTSDVVTTDTNINETLTFISSSSTNYTTTISGTTATITVNPTYYASLSKIALNVYILYFEQRETYYYEYDITNGRVLYDEPSLNHFDITVKHYNNVFTFTMHCDVDITDLNFFSVYMYADDDEKELRYKYSRETTHPYILNTNTTVGSVIADIAPKATLIDYYDVKKASADDSNKFVILKDLIDLIHPVGSIYTSMCNISPAQIFPNTTWTQIVDRFLYCASTGAGTTGGSATHTHTTGDCTLTVNQIPSHNHDNSQYAGYYICNGGAQPTGVWNSLKIRSDAPQDDFHTVYTGNRGGGQAHNHGNTGSASNLPPYITVYAWYRTS